MTTELATVNRDEVSVVSMLEHAKEWLATAVETTGPAEIAAAKAQIAAAETYARELSLSKDIQADATEMVRRAEYALRRSATEAQRTGEVRSHGDSLIPGARTRSLVHPTSSDDRPSAKDFFRNPSEYEDANAMGCLEPDQFEAVIQDARDEGNLSRANVARLSREKAGKPVTERNFQEAELVSAFRANLRPLMKPRNVSTLSPKARALLIDLLQEAIQTLKEADS